jgi:hypothetical protein
MTCLKSLQFSWKRRSFHFEKYAVLHRGGHIYRLHQMINTMRAQADSASPAGWVLPEIIEHCALS